MHTQLEQIIIELIQESPHQRITFERFMELALYEPTYGYYTHSGGLIGARGDFYTSPHLTPIFGELLAKQVVDFWQSLGQPQRFDIVEVGAGQGLLASDILGYLRLNKPSLWSGLTYTIVELSPALRLAQRRRLEAVPHGSELILKVQWRDLVDLLPNEISGCFVSNELLDALPVHLVTIVDKAWQEIYVGFEDDQFQEIIGELSSPAIAAYFQRLGLQAADYEEGYRSEVNLRMADWLQEVARVLRQGYVLTIDYGYPAHQRYNPRRTAGTLQCYLNHAVHDNPYIKIGQQDITSHVDFTSLIQIGLEHGLQEIGFTRQAYFLASLGIGDKLAELSTADYRLQVGLTIKQQIAEHEALQRLINPSGLGNFGVLFQAKNLPPAARRPAGLALK